MTLGVDAVSSSTQACVLVIITAFNAPEALKRCLNALNSQTRLPDGVLVVDNSQPLAADLTGVDERIAGRTRLVPTGENLGPAGGFALGLALFQQEGQWTHAWVMDDDCYPDHEALDHLLHVAAGLRPGHAIQPLAVNEETNTGSIHPGWTGVLLDRTAVALGGLPRPEFFWWAEDTEYLQHRLPMKGVVVARAEEARVLYDMVRRPGGRPPWKYYYEVRNLIYYRLYLRKRGRLRMARQVARLFGSAITSSRRAQSVRMCWRGLLDGVGGRLGIRVVPGD